MGNGVNKIMIPADKTLTEFVDETFATDIVVTNLTNNNNLTSSSLATVITTVFPKYKVSGSISNGGWNDASASAAGVPVGGVYYTTNGQVKVRLS